jgi:glutamate-1-semialdehyde 2,1-aminomutase
MKSRYSKSEEFLERAEKAIPLGSQTFSKSRTQYPVGISPLFATRGKGAFLWDLDGNRYIDLVSNLASITLGYSHRRLDEEIRRQLKKGIGFSLPGKIETEVAEKIIELVPSAEKVRFAKNGTDATSAAIRLGRAYTGRDHVVVCGYHGWQDWYIGSTTRNKGVPRAISALTLKFEYNNIQSLKDVFTEYPDKIACVILEPMNSTYPKPGFLREVVDLCEKNGAVCIFDETITGFRYSNGGAQKYFGVTPHISTFGKGIANGYPLSVVCGRNEIMNEMKEIFFSGTFGGELLSLTAANLVLDMHLTDEICPILNSNGEKLNVQIENTITSTGMHNHVTLTGHPTWKFINWKNSEDFSSEVLKTFFMQEAFKQGLLVLSTHNVTLAHKKEVIRRVVTIYENILAEMKNLIDTGCLTNRLEVEPVTSLFKVRS